MKNTIINEPHVRIVWRLSKLPTVDELLKLVDSKLITQEDAKEILFNLETIEDRDTKSLQSEIKFLRELVQKLSTNRSQIITTIKEIEVPYKRWDWYRPYCNWTTIDLGNCTTANHIDGIASAGTCIVHADATLASFSDIKTF